MKKRCIIHYKGLSNYSNLKQLSKTNKERILLAKAEREKLGGKHYHRDQCDGVPESLVKMIKYTWNHATKSSP